MTGWLHISSAAKPLGIDWSWLVYPIAEHRLVVQRLWSLLVAGLNGREWDVYAELFLNTFLWGGFTALCVVLFGRRLPPAGLACFALFVAVAEAIPHAWENLLWSFQSQFLFLVAFSVAAIALFASAAAWSARWWGGVLCAAAAFGSQAAGLACLPIGALLLLVQARRSSGRPRLLAALAALALLALAGIFAPIVLRASADHANRALAVSVWWQACASLLAWPRRLGRASLVLGWCVAAVEGLVLYTAELSDRPTAATVTQKMSLNLFAETREPQRHAYLAYVRTHDPRTLQTSPVIYPVPAHLAEIVDRLRRVHRWPAALDPARASALPWLSRLARHAAPCGALLLSVACILLFDTLWRSGRPPAAAAPAPSRWPPSSLS